MIKGKIEEKILLSIIGEKDSHYQEKIKEIKNMGISRVALFSEKLLRLK